MYMEKSRTSISKINTFSTSLRPGRDGSMTSSHPLLLTTPRMRNQTIGYPQQLMCLTKSLTSTQYPMFPILPNNRMKLTDKTGINEAIPIFCPLT